MAIELKRILALFLSCVMIAGPCFGQSRTDQEDTIKRRTDSTTYQKDTTQRMEDTITYRDNTIIYRDAAIKYREALTKYLEDFTYYRFGESINGVYVITLQNQEYINAHIIIDNSPPINLSSIIGNVIVGSIFIVAAIVLPPLAAGSPSVFAVIVTQISAANVVQASLMSAAIGASIS